MASVNSSTLLEVISVVYDDRSVAELILFIKICIKLIIAECISV